MKRETVYEAVIVVAVGSMFVGLIPVGVGLLIAAAAYAVIRLVGKVNSETRPQRAAVADIALAMKADTRRQAGFEFGEDR